MNWNEISAPESLTCCFIMREGREGGRDEGGEEGGLEGRRERGGKEGGRKGTLTDTEECELDKNLLN